MIAAANTARAIPIPGRPSSAADTMHSRLVGQKYLVVDHIASRARATRAQLKTAGLHRVEICASAEMAIDFVHAGMIGAVVVAFDLDGIGGIEFTKRLRRMPDPSLRQTPVIMISAEPSKEILGRAIDAGVNEFLAAPFSVRDLYGRIYRAILAPKPFVVSATYVGPLRGPNDMSPSGMTGDPAGRQKAS